MEIKTINMQEMRKHLAEYEKQEVILKEKLTWHQEKSMHKQ